MSFEARKETLVPIGEEQRLEPIDITRTWEIHVEAPVYDRAEPWGLVSQAIVKLWNESLAESETDTSTETIVYTPTDFAPTQHRHSVYDITGISVLSFTFLEDWRVNEEDMRIEGRYQTIMVPVVSSELGEWTVLHQGGTC